MYSGLTNEKRKQIYKRDGWQCALCSCTRYLQIHHYIPRGQGGSDYPDNLITLCSTCHAQVHGYIPLPSDEWTIEDMEQAIVEYLEDYYMEDWYPYK